MHRLERVAATFEALRGELRSPELAVEANELMMASAYLTIQVADLFGLKHLGGADLAVFERSIQLGTCKREAAFQSAEARCKKDGSGAPVGVRR